MWEYKIVGTTRLYGLVVPFIFVKSTQLTHNRKNIYIF